MSARNAAGIHVAAYAASGGLDPAGEAALYQGLADLGVAGLEQPFYGTLHRRDEGWLIGQIHPDWTLVLTLLPGFFDLLERDQRYGLASIDLDGRRRALDFAESACAAVGALHGKLGRRAVRAVLVHSAPRLGSPAARSSAEAFADSLSRLRALDWGGASLLVEHCDAYKPGQPPDKGFLSLADDLAAARLSSGPTPIGVALNWGRSAVETRSAEGPVEHARFAAGEGLLGALFFSGVTPSHPEYGEWRDWHAPFSTSCPESLLTPAAAKATLAAAGGCPIVGLKLQAKPASTPVAGRLALIGAGLAALR